MFFADRITLGTPRRTSEGYLAVRCRAARAGIYDYLGREIDPTGQHFAADQVVKVYRPESEVFAKDAVHSFLMKPITDDHPSTPVTADNWGQLAKGVNAGALRDGDFLAFDLVLMDKALIDAVDSGKRELSNGYASEIVIEAGTTDSGEHYDAVQRKIRGNHIAVVDRGRAGPMCRIGDAARCDALPVPQEILDHLADLQRTYADGDGNSKSNPTNAGRQSGDLKMPHTLMIDGLQVPNVSDEAKAAIEKLQGQARDAAARADKAEADVAKLTTDKATLESEKADLAKQLADAKISPAALRDAAKAYALTKETAERVAPQATITDEMDEPAIRRAAVSARLGDAAKDWSDDQVAISFDTLAAQVADAAPIDPVRQAITNKPVIVADAAAVRDAARAMQYN